jgi:uncharacterized SAM-binding protein YcdF (DUF218 family)
VIRRIVSLLLVLWAFGFLWFAVALPQPAAGEKTDAIVVPTGSGGRIDRGLSMLRGGAAGQMLVSGVDEDVRPREFAAEYDVPEPTMECCVTLGFAALDTRGNARETSAWVEARKVRSLRLVTSDWHMRRAALELENALPAGTVVVRDAVRTEPSLWTLFLEYHKLLASWLVQALPG